jgi:tripartite-type tricarboxylate transporter receptor subunit TctC
MTISECAQRWENKFTIEKHEKQRSAWWSSTPLQFVVKCLVIVVALVLAPALGKAQTVPSLIRFIVPFPPGGPVDFTARVVANKVQQDLGNTIIIENRGGANGAVGAVAVKLAAPDGGTFLFASSGMITISPHLVKGLGYDPIKDFVPITMVAYADAVLVVGNMVKAKTLQEFIAEAKASSKPLTISSAGVGNITHGQLELFKDAARVDLQHVPYKGGAPALTDVLTGQISGTFVGLNVALPHIRAGTLRALAIVGDKRSESAPEIPTMAELGYPTVDCLTWMGLMAPKNTPIAISNMIAASINRAVNDPETKSKLAVGGVTPWILSQSEFRDYIARENTRWHAFIDEHHMAIE